MGLELVHRDEHAQRDQCVDDALGQQRHHDGHQARDQSTDERDEGTQKDQGGQRQRQRDAHDRQPRADPGGVGKGHQEGGPHIPGQRPVTGAARLAHPVPDVGREDLGHVGPDVAPAVQEEDQREQHQHRRRDQLRDGGRGGQGTAFQLRLIVAQRLDRGVARVVDLFAAQVRRPVDQPAPGGLDAAGHLFGQARQTVDELDDNEGQDAAQDREPTQQHQRDRAPAGQTPPIQPVHHGQQQSADQQRHQHRDDDDLELIHHPEQGDQRQEDDQQTPGPGCGLADNGFDRSVVGVCRHWVSLSGAGHGQTCANPSARRPGSAPPARSGYDDDTVGAAR